MNRHFWVRLSILLAVVLGGISTAYAGDTSLEKLESLIYAQNWVKAQAYLKENQSTLSLLDSVGPLNMSILWIAMHPSENGTELKEREEMTADLADFSSAQKAFVDDLLKTEPRLIQANTMEHTPLFTALTYYQGLSDHLEPSVAANYAYKIKYLLDHGADPLSPFRIVDAGGVDFTGTGYLYNLFAGEVDSIQLLLKLGVIAKPLEQNLVQMQPELMRISLWEALILEGQFQNRVFKHTASYYALVEQLLKQGAPIDQNIGSPQSGGPRRTMIESLFATLRLVKTRSPKFMPVALGVFERIVVHSKTLNGDIDKRLITSEGAFSLLEMAYKYGHPEVAQALIKQGAQMNKVRPYVWDIVLSDAVINRDRAVIDEVLSRYSTLDLKLTRLNARLTADLFMYQPTLLNMAVASILADNDAQATYNWILELISHGIDADITSAANFSVKEEPRWTMQLLRDGELRTENPEATYQALIELDDMLNSPQFDVDSAHIQSSQSRQPFTATGRGDNGEECGGFLTD